MKEDVANQFRRQPQWPRWNPENFCAKESFKYQYPQLADEILVDNVYIVELVRCNGRYQPDLVDLTQFVEHLLTAIEQAQDDLKNLKYGSRAYLSKLAQSHALRDALQVLVGQHPEINSDAYTLELQKVYEKVMEKHGILSDDDAIV